MTLMKTRVDKGFELSANRLVVNLAFHGGVVNVLSSAERRLSGMVSRVEHDDVDAVLAKFHPHAS